MMRTFYEVQNICILYLFLSTPLQILVRAKIKQLNGPFLITSLFFTMLKMKIQTFQNSYVSSILVYTSPRQKNVNVQLHTNISISLFLWLIHDHSLCDVWMEKTQILIADQKEGGDLNKKSTARD